jgi:Protein of unknown function (DUF3237)
MTTTLDTAARSASPRRPDREPYYRLDAHFTDIQVIGPVAEGLRMNGHFAGTITVGDGLVGATLVGVDFFRIRADGVGIVDAHEVLTVDGHNVAVRLHGYVLPPTDTIAPTLEEMITPGFAWPDVDHRIEAFATFSAAAPELAHLNRVTVVHTGAVNFATLKITVVADRLG